MAGRHPIARGFAVLFTVVALFFVAVVALTALTDGKVFASLSRGGKVGVVEVAGAINESRHVVEALKGFAEADGIKAVVVRVESPGGGVAPSQEIYQAIRKLRERKPVVASLGGVAASGGYYIAAACDAIVANPGTITGSIGVIAQLPVIQGLLEKLGVQAQVLKAGEHKDMGSPVRPLSDEERALFQQMIDSVHAQFIAAVVEGRKMEEPKVRALADGRVFSGEQAHQVGLVDVLGGLEDAVKLAGERGGITGEPRVSRAVRRNEPWWWNLLFDTHAPAAWLDLRPALGLQLLYGGLFLR